MKENQLETELKLNKSQLQSVINNHIVQGDGLNELFNMMINGLMFSPELSIGLISNGRH